MPIPFQQANGLMYNVYDKLPMGVGFSRVFNNTASTLLKFKALNLDTDGVRYADNVLNLECHGFAWEDILPNTWGEMCHDSTLYQLDWFLDTQPSSQYLTQGQHYFLGENGNITPTAPNTGLIQELGFAVSIHEFAVEIQGITPDGGAIGAILAQLAALDARIDTVEAEYMSKLVYDADDNALVDSAERLEEIREALPILAPAQTAFTLSKAPFQAPLSRLNLNGLEQRYGTDYTIAGVNLSWISSIILAPSDVLEIIYR